MMKKLLAVVFAAALLLAACVRAGPSLTSTTLPTLSTTSPTSTPPPPTPTPPGGFSLPELKYRLLSFFGDVFFCDPDFYPVAREGQEEKNALEQFPAIRADTAEFKAILQRTGLPDKDSYANEDKVRIYREHKKLNFAVQTTASGDGYQFVLRVGEGQGQRIEGTIARSGQITVLKRETSFNTCPICLTEGTLIDTPGGPVAVEELRAGMAVWTLDVAGNRVVGVIEETSKVPVPISFQVVTVKLSDGRSVTASPGHSTADGKALGDYRMGDSLDGAIVMSAERVVYDGGATYDILPSGGTGLYWANGVLLRSTLLLLAHNRGQ